MIGSSVRRMDTVDVLVVGAGLAGLNTARLLAQAGLDVAVCERRTSLETGIRTTGIFVRRTLDDYELPHLGPAVPASAALPAVRRRNPVEFGEHSRRVPASGDMEGIYAEAVEDAERAGAHVHLNSSYPAKSTKARFTIGADGARSTVARTLGLDVNRQLITGIEEVYPVATGSTPTFHCVVDPRIAPGYIAWVIDDGEHAHIGLAGRADRFPAPLPQLLQRFRDSFPAPGARRSGEAPRRADSRRRAAAPDRVTAGTAGRRRRWRGLATHGGRTRSVHADVRARGLGHVRLPAQRQQVRAGALRRRGDAPPLPHGRRCGVGCRSSGAGAAPSSRSPCCAHRQERPWPGGSCSTRPTRRQRR